jgi:hydrogenase maturation protein HypF
MWGGEVLRADMCGYDRLGHLEELPMPGGEAAIEDPRRLVWAAHNALGREAPERFATDEEAAVWARLLPRAPVTSGLGRFLDCVSVFLGAAGRMTYDGEPAMRLEPLLEAGEQRPKWGFRTERTTSGEVGVLSVLDTLFGLSLRTGQDRADAATAAVTSVVAGLADAAAEAAVARGLPVGVTGGVVYSMPILRLIERRVADAGARLLMHSRVPPGDGGISAGQAALAGHALG